MCGGPVAEQSLRQPRAARYAVNRGAHDDHRDADDTRDVDDFYAAYYPRVLGLAVAAYGPADAEDLAQETMARALAAYDRLDPARDPWPWLVAIARNIACDRYRARRPAVPLDESAGDPGGPATPYDAAVAAEERRLVRRALGRLSSVDRRLLVLREWHELSFRDIASLVGGEPATLRQQVFRARRRFAREFTELGGRALGMGTTLGARWWRLRVRSADGTYGLPYAAQLAAALTAAGVLAWPGATGSVAGAAEPRTVPGANRRAPVVATANLDGRATDVGASFATVAGRAGTPGGGTAPRGPAKRDRGGAGPGSVQAGTYLKGVPGTPGSRSREHVAVEVGDRRVYLDKWQWSEAQRDVLCRVPAVTCQ